MSRQENRNRGEATKEKGQQTCPDVTRSSHSTDCASCCKFCEIYLLRSERTSFLLLLFTQNVAEATSFYPWASAGRRSRCAFRRSFEKCCSRFRNSPVDAAQETKISISKMNRRTNNGHGGEGIWNRESAINQKEVSVDREGRKGTKEWVFCLFCFFFAAAKSETVIVGQRCRVSVLLFRNMRHHWLFSL